jgi:hypothetical protein
MKPDTQYGDMTLGNAIGEVAYLTNQALQHDLNNEPEGDTDIAYARRTLKLLEDAAQECRAAIVASNQDKRYK